MLQANPNVIAKLKAEHKDLTGKIERLSAFINKHYDADNNYIGDIGDDFYSDFFEAQKPMLEEQYQAMIRY